MHILEKKVAQLETSIKLPNLEQGLAVPQYLHDPAAAVREECACEHCDPNYVFAPLNLSQSTPAKIHIISVNDKRRLSSTEGGQQRPNK